MQTVIVTLISGKNVILDCKSGSGSMEIVWGTFFNGKRYYAYTQKLEKMCGYKIDTTLLSKV